MAELHTPADRRGSLSDEPSQKTEGSSDTDTDTLTEFSTRSPVSPRSLPKNGSRLSSRIRRKTVPTPVVAAPPKVTIGSAAAELAHNVVSPRSQRTRNTSGETVNSRRTPEGTPRKSLQQIVNRLQTKRTSRPPVSRQSQVWWEDVRTSIHTSTRKNKALMLLAHDLSFSARQRRIGAFGCILYLSAVLVAATNAVVKHWTLDVALSAITLCDLVTTTLVHVENYQQSKLWKADWKELYPWFVVSPGMLTLIPRLAVIGLHCPTQVATKYGHGARALNAAIVLRGTLHLRTVSTFTDVVRSSAAAITAALSGQKISTFFAYKVLLFKEPILVMVTTFVLGFFALSLAVWMVESNEGVDDVGRWDFEQAMWHTAVTFTTVGYGDLVPGSPFGKLVSVISAIFGTFVTAILVGVVQHKLVLGRTQKQMIMFLAEVEHGRQIKLIAGRVILHALVYNQSRKAALRATGAVPEHKAAFTVDTFSAPVHQRVLRQAYTSLLNVVGSFRLLRSEEGGGLGWVDISVLDVLHADTSDLLAQNTVMQYLMRPADEELSQQLRGQKRRNQAPIRRSSFVQSRKSSAGSLARGISLSLPPRRPSFGPSQRRLSISLPLPGQPTEPPPLPQLRRNSSKSSRCSDVISVASTARTKESQATLRTAASTRHLVDMLKSYVTKPEHPPCPNSPGEAEPAVSPPQVMSPESRRGSFVWPEMADIAIDSPPSSPSRRPLQPGGPPERKPSRDPTAKGPLQVDSRRVSQVSDRSRHSRASNTFEGSQLQEMLAKADDMLQRQEETGKQLTSIARILGVAPQALSLSTGSMHQSGLPSSNGFCLTSGQRSRSVASAGGALPAAGRRSMGGSQTNVLPAKAVPAASTSSVTGLMAGRLGPAKSSPQQSPR
eukprot:TRINITY_DN17109_c0_g1_i1.p1 TRINITY_DN17109_c0_g1~~TRINITY_DN17109_c0_g1_i1.p1  ORF type:complete len:891 (+),score=164.64 TRINITY_DN17109_c0_g1_i1:82-2754(+)